METGLAMVMPVQKTGREGGAAMKKWIAAAAAACMICLAGTGVSAAGTSYGQGTAVFDFGDSAFFAVKMYEGQCVYLSLDEQYDAAMAQEFYEQAGIEADHMLRFDTNGQSFARTGALFVQADEDQQVYALDEDGNFRQLEAVYAESYVVGKDGRRLSGYIIYTDTLGDYVVA